MLQIEYGEFINLHPSSIIQPIFSLSFHIENPILWHIGILYDSADHILTLLLISLLWVCIVCDVLIKTGYCKTLAVVFDRIHCWWSLLNVFIVYWGFLHILINHFLIDISLSFLISFAFPFEMSTCNSKPMTNNIGRL